jgi:hypothetical protein
MGAIYAMVAYALGVLDVSDGAALCETASTVVGAGGGRGMVTFAGVGSPVNDNLVQDLLLSARVRLSILKYYHVPK